MNTKARDSGILLGCAMLCGATAIGRAFAVFNRFNGSVPKDHTPRADTRERVPSKYDGA